MALHVTTTAHGAPALDALAAAVRRAQGAAPLRAVAVVVPTNTAGVMARRALGRRGGFAAIDVLTMFRLAELLGAPALHAQQRRPVSTPVVDVAVKQVLRQHPGLYAGVQHHPSTVVALRDLYRELRIAGPGAVTALARTERGGEPARVAAEVMRALRSRWYDEGDLLEAAAARATTDPPERLSRLVLHLPQRLRPLERELLAALAERGDVEVVIGLTGHGPADADVLALGAELAGGPIPAPPPAEPPGDRLAVVSTTDADDEVRIAVRAVLDAARDGTPFDRIAVLFPSDRPYARLVEHHLDAAGIPWNGRPGTTVGERMAPRVLVELLGLDRRGVRRAELMALLADVPPVRGGRRVPTARWERISRRAGVVREGDWAPHLARFAADARTDLEHPSRRHDADAADELAAFVAELRSELGDPAAARPWVEWRAWSLALLERWFGAGRLDRLDGAEAQAWSDTTRVLDRLQHLDDLGPPVTREEFRSTFVAELDITPGRHGKVGDGVHVSTVAGAAGIDVDAVVVLGAADGLVPPAPVIDPLLGDRERRAAGLAVSDHLTGLVHRQFLAATTSTPRALVTVPRGDLRATAARQPTRWLAPLGAAEHVVDSHAHGLAQTTFPVSADEHRLRELWVRGRAGEDIRTLDVARHDDALGRAITLRDARASSTFTEFDGNLTGHPIGPLPDVVSPTQLEAWPACPHAYFVQYVLGVRRVEDPETIETLSPLDRGAALHAAIDALHQAVLAGELPEPGAAGWGDEHGAFLRQAGADVAADLEQRGRTGRAAFWANERAELDATLQRWLEFENAGWRGGRIVASELTFGHPPVQLALPDGRTVGFRGQIDRVDELPGGRLVVTDHKTGKPNGLDDLCADDPTLAATHFQLPVYAAAARQALQRPEADVEVGYTFFRPFGRTSVAFDGEVWKRVGESLAVVVAGIEHGVFPALPARPGFRLFVPCWYCEPDGLGTALRWAEWERKRHDPVLARWFADEPEDGVNVQLSLLDVLEAVEEAPPDHEARERIRTDVGSTLFVEAGAGAGKTTALVGRILTLVDDGVPIDAIAAITFTEKAAAELRHRVRQRLGEAPLTAQRRAALDGLDHAPVGTLHAFARRILFELPVEAGLPPGFGVLDELESQLALDERWDDLLDTVLDDAGAEVAPGLPAAELVQLIGWGGFGGSRGLRRVVEDFQGNWDLVERRVELDPPPRPAARPPVLGRAVALAATSAPPGDTQEDVLAAVAQRAGEVGAAVGLGAHLTALEALRDQLGRASRRGDRRRWAGRIDELDALRTEAADIAAVIDAELADWRRYRELVVGAICGRFVLDGARTRAAAGTLEFHDLLVLARRLLATNATARRLLHHRYQRLLLDEFQDTDPIQLEIAVRLTADPTDQPPDDIAALRPLPGRLFVVGDPKQSIYRFRRADIATYLGAASHIGADRAVLSANFRSTAAVIDWVNGVFGAVIEAQPDVQPAYGALDACRPAPRHHGTVRVLAPEQLEPDDGEELRADDLRWRESAAVAAAVASALRDGWSVGDGDGGLRPCQPGDIAVLLPARTSLPMLEAALAELAIPYRAENAAVVYLAPEVRDVMLALRAAADPSDELALVAALRSPLYGCSDVELVEWRAAGGRFDLLARPPDGAGDHPVAAAIAHVRSIADGIGTSPPAELLDRLVVERRVLETALAGTDARDVWRRIRYVVDQARAWTDAGGRGVRRYLRWAAYQAQEGRASDTILPERDHDAVRVMTVHAAKGLEFPITVLSGMTTEVQRRPGTSVVWLPGGWTLTGKGNELFEEFRPVDEQMGDAERRRLLYVACTRAVDHLVVSLHRKAPRGTATLANSPSAHVLAACGAAGHAATALDEVATPRPRPAGEALELPWADPAEWRAERDRAMAVGCVRSATSATGLAVALSAAGDDDAVADPGLAKDGVDLDQPPWQRGRYGTAVGRAVHAVLQDADLATGADIEVLAAAQCASEGIFGLEQRVAALCRSALAAPIVVAAAGGAEHWRELFVVAELGHQVLEGYIDLLVRTPSGLVIVDYKTDQWRPGADQHARATRYRHQLAAYGFALGRLLDEPIAGGLLVRCRVDAPAEQIELTDWPAAIAAVAATAG